MANRYWLKSGSPTTFVFTAVAYMAYAFYYTSNLPTLRTFSRDKASWSSSSPATLRHLIPDIIFISTKEQMLRIYANRVVAVMQNVKGFIEVAVSKFVTIAMNSMSPIVNTKLAIASTLTTSGFPLPLPTLFRATFLDVSPKPVFCSAVQGVTMSNKVGIVFRAVAQTPSLFVALVDSAFHTLIVAQSRRVF